MYMIIYIIEILMKLKIIKNLCLDNAWKNKVKESLNVVGNWYFTKDGIRVVFQKDSIGCSTQGITYIDVDKSDINSYLKDTYKIN